LLSVLNLLGKKKEEKLSKILQIIGLNDVGTHIFSKNEVFITDLFQLISNEEEANSIISEFVKFTNISSFLHLKMVTLLSGMVNVTHLGIIKEIVEIGISNENNENKIRKKYEIIFEKLKEKIDISQLSFLKQYLNVE
jgi:hypothetical protein